MVTILAANIADQSGRIILSCLMLLGAFFVLGFVVWYYRRWQQRPTTSSTATWSLDDLIRMREEGQLTESEFRQLRSTLINAFTGNLKTDSRPLSNSKAGPDAEQADEAWDWVADEDDRGRFDVKRQSPG